MAYTTTQLITGAYYASGVVSRGFETVNGEQVSDGLIWLNENISKKIIEPDIIPYETEDTFTASVGVKDYQIDNIMMISTLTFLKDSVRYPVEYIPRKQFKGSGRIETITSLPYQYFYEPNFSGATLSLYFLPDQPYVFTINGVYRLNEVTLNQDLSLTLNKFYLTFLRYELTEKICLEFSMPLPVAVEREINSYRALISKQSRPLDPTVYKKSTLTRENGGLSWAYVNLGTGFVP